MSVARVILIIAKALFHRATPCCPRCAIHSSGAKGFVKAGKKAPVKIAGFARIKFLGERKAARIHLKFSSFFEKIEIQKLGTSFANTIVLKVKTEMGCALKICSFGKVFTIVTIILSTFANAHADSRIKDLADIEGVRENMLIGYGLVVGLDGSGDRIRNTPFTRESLISMLERLGVNIRSETLDTDNIAAVMVTASLPAFATQGARIDVSVSALGDAESLRGGVLLATPLQGADGEVYAIAQGSVAINGFTARGAAASITRGVPTNGRIANGGVVEREIKFSLNSLPSAKLALRNPDFTTAKRIAAAVNSQLNAQIAFVPDPGTVRIDLPEDYAGDMVSLISEIENLRVVPDQVAKVVVDEASGVVVMGSDVRVSTVAIAQGTLTVSISETPQVSQPSPFSENGSTVVVPRTDASVDEQPGQLKLVEEGVRLSDLVDGLNALGVPPRDMISILQAIKAAGALQADIEVL